MSSNVVTHKRRNKRRTDTTRHEVAKFAGDAYDLGRRALKGVAYLKALINIETKYLDTFASGAAVASPGNVLGMSLMAQGTTNTTRVGNSIRLQNVEFNFTVLKHSSATSTAYRVVLVRDNENQGAAPALADVLASGGGAYGHVSPYGFTALASQRFAILADVTCILDANNLTAFRQIKLAHHGHIKFRGTDATAASQDAGSLWLICSNNEATNVPTLTYWCRFTFTDD